MFRYHGSYGTCTAGAKLIVVVSQHSSQWWIPKKQGNFERFYIFTCYHYEGIVSLSLNNIF